MYSNSDLCGDQKAPTLTNCCHISLAEIYHIFRLVSVNEVVSEDVGLRLEASWKRENFIRVDPTLNQKKNGIPFHDHVRVFIF